MDDFELVLTDATLEKLKIKHDVTVLEVEEAFFNWEGSPLKDKRAKHKTRPSTVWFISATSEGRILKVVGIPFADRKEFVLKSAFEPDDWEIKYYEKNQ